MARSCPYSARFVRSAATSLTCSSTAVFSSSTSRRIAASSSPTSS
eukprot:CAMPEP_0179994010 /NCGR_PEP_ID=MMETSP0984-20121128/6332_1 /TAXON_ID=483367 /ORGANISM="non described non described, Strain CCMP 2436" /LENGTH=44 /DNA_ID= /DNA_START= /DNA_END= /DNA_ORIENTATION=